MTDHIQVILADTHGCHENLHYLVKKLSLLK